MPKNSQSQKVAGWKSDVRASTFRPDAMIDLQGWHTPVPLTHPATSLLNAKAVRQHCEEIMAYVAQGDSPHFVWQETRMPAIAAYVAEVIRERYPDLKPDVEFLHEFSSMNQNVDLAGRIVFNEKKQEVFNFGKHKGRPVVDVLKAEPQYYDWMMRGDFPLHTKQKLTEILNRTLLKNN